MQAARQQALGYVRALPRDEARPPFVLVVDVGYCIDVYSNFTGVGDTFVPFPDQSRYRLSLASLAEADTLEMLRRVFTDPRALDPSRRAARVTRELAGYLAQLSAQLERAGHAPDAVAQFLMRCLFTMFSEDVGLIPKASFTGMMQEYSSDDLRPFLPDALQNLWQVMDKGGFSPGLKARLRRFNGKLFHDATALPLNADQVALLVKAGWADWTTVEPAIFGTLLERAFPFPDATPAEQTRIRELAEQLDAHRKRQQAQHAKLTLTDLYNVVEKLKTGEALSAKEQATHQQGLASVVLSLHQQLDAAVADAYGWPTDLPEADLLSRLVRLNLARAQEEQAGHIRYLRPAYQAPDAQQTTLAIGSDPSGKTTAPAKTGKLEWPKELAQQMRAVRDAVQQADGPQQAAQVAALFGRTKPEIVQPMLDTLTALALLRRTENTRANLLFYMNL